MKKINIAEILKYCPKGIQLYSPICGECTFDSLNKGTIICITQNNQKITFTSEGYYMLPVFEDSECVLFPSKEIRDWNNIRYFKDADIVAATIPHTGTWVGIFKQYTNNKFESYCFVSAKGVFNNIGLKEHSLVGTHLASEEEKQKLFQAIKDNGYHWNAETKTLEKLVESKEDTDRPVMAGIYFDRENYADEVELYLGNYEIEIRDGKTYAVFKNQKTKTLEKLIEPKFKVGDRIKHKENTRWVCTIVRVEDRYYVDGHPTCYTLPFGKQNEYELVHNKFDINTLKPFESRVLVRDTDTDIWIGAFYSHHKPRRFYTIGSSYYYQLIPYEGNEHLLDTTRNCDDFYKTW